MPKPAPRGENGETTSSRRRYSLAAYRLRFFHTTRIQFFQPEFLLHRSETISTDNSSGDESCADLFPGHYGTPTSQETHRRSRNCSVQSFAVPAERMDVLGSQDGPPVCVCVCVCVCACNDTLIVVLTPGLTISIAAITEIVRIVSKSTKSNARYRPVFLNFDFNIKRRG